MVYSFLTRESGGAGAELFSLFTILLFSVVAHWNRLPTDIVTAPSLLKFKKGLDSALSHMV